MTAPIEPHDCAYVQNLEELGAMAGALMMAFLEKHEKDPAFFKGLPLEIRLMICNLAEELDRMHTRFPGAMAEGGRRLLARPEP